jgi:hypothetical protein
MSQQQTILRVYSNSLDNQGVLSPYDFLDLYSSIPIKINKSVAELQDISKKNSDFSIGLQLPGSKRNNRFFENFFNVDTQSLYFDATKRVQCDVLLDSEPYFRGYMRLNKVAVLNSKVEYDVTLYSTVGDIFGKIGNNLLKDLDFSDTEYTFNHIFTQAEVTSKFYYSNFYLNQENPYPYFYPIVHNGYNYYSSSGATIPNISGNTTGATLIDQTRIYTSTSPINAWSTLSGATAAGAQEYFINSPTYGLRDNQLKPALSIWNLMKLMFKTYGYTISGDFLNTPWIKTLYLYGYFSSELTKFSYKINSIQTLPLEGVELRTAYINPTTYLVVVCKLGTGIPCYCTDDINFQIICFPSPTPTATGPIPTSTPTPTPGGPTPTPSSTPIPTATPTPVPFGNQVIRAGTSGYTATNCALDILSSFDVPADRFKSVDYLPQPVGTAVSYVDGDSVLFSLVIDPAIKQIDLLSSIAKKFNLVFVPDPNNPNQINIEPFDYYMGTGNVYDWTPKISFDKGFTVEPSLNFIESTLFMTDLEDGDDGNKIFKAQNNRIYGQNIIYNPTDFKSQEKKIDTIFSPELIRKWDENIGLPLGINYAATNEISSYDNQVRWMYKGVKSKPKLFFWLGGFNPFIDQINEVYFNGSGFVNTYSIKIQDSISTGVTSPSEYEVIPTISHTMPMGLGDQYKINNDSLSILFNSELPVNVGVQTFNTYTENDVYTNFYSNRISNLYDPNTRFLTGNFDLKYSDIQNLSPNDIIKINEQYFIVNKINDFNLTNRELTKVELVQFNNNPQSYVDRYFAYYYCDDPDVCYKLKTDFTNPNLLDTNYIWSIYYDRQVGSLSGQTSGFTSSFRYFNIDPTGSTDYVSYNPYTMYEITEDEYTNGSCLSWTGDTFLYDLIYNSIDPTNSPMFAMASYWENRFGTRKGSNIFENCEDFYNTADTYGIRTRNVPLQSGRYIMLQYYYPWVSVDGGYTFTERTSASPRFYSDFCINLNGSRFYGITDGLDKLYLSTNYGVSWSQISTSPTMYWTAVYCSSNGQHITGISSAGWYVSSDYGATWYTVSPSSSFKFKSDVYMDSTGGLLIAGNSGVFFDSDPFVYAKRAFDVGTGTTYANLTNAPQAYWQSVCVSDSGQYIGLFGEFSETGSTDDRQIWTSNDYGATFTYRSTLKGESSQISMSSDGKYWVINSRGFFIPSIAAIWVSSDYGATFTNVGGGDGAYGNSAISQNGKTMMVSANISHNSGLSFSSTGVPSYSAVAINR